MKKKSIKSYEQAMHDLQAIVQELQENKISMDDLTSKVKYANELIEYCKVRLMETEDAL